MLNPQNRLIYLEELQPPAGYTLDCALGTTFSLDLLALFLVPLSVAHVHVGSTEELTRNQLAFVESIQRMTEKISIFCQQGRISSVKRRSNLYSLLEPMINEVRLPRNQSVFHPKIWLLRYKSAGDIFYRFLCLSRNLTFDHSWDTLLTLEGKVQENLEIISTNQPLADFIRSLPGLSGKVSSQTEKQVELMAQEVLQVKFEKPEGFSHQISFLPFVSDNSNWQEVFGEYSRAMIISPFLTADVLDKLFSRGKDHILITRPESLDGLTDAQLDKLQTNTQLLVLREGVDKPDELPEIIESEADGELEGASKAARELAVSSEATGGPGLVSEAEGTLTLEEDGEDEQVQVDLSADAPVDIDDLSGLHAKLYVLEKGQTVRLFTGSANATNPGLTGKNVEFLTGLRGHKDRCGIDTLLGNARDKHALRALLEPYSRSEDLDTSQLAHEKELDDILEQCRYQLLDAEVKMRVEKNPQNTYNLLVQPENELHLAPGVSLSCYPTTLKASNAQKIAIPWQERPVIFAELDIVSLTSFMLFDLQIKEERRRIRFVLKLPCVGMPGERDQKIIQNLITDTDAFMQYLLFLLAEPKNDLLSRGLIIKERSAGQDVNAPSILQLPVLEELVRAYSRNPDKIKRLEEIFTGLEAKAGVEIPREFADLLKVLVAAGGKRGTRK